MEIRALRYFLTVASEENITKAAQSLHVTQPTLSRQMKQLEEEMGVKLFTRGKHSVTLTQEGVMLRRRAQEITALADKIKTDIVQPQETLTGEIVIGCGETANVHDLAKAIESFKKIYPRVHFYIYTATADDAKAGIERGIIDIGILMEPVEIARYNFIRMRQREQWGVLTRLDSPLAKKEYVTPGDLSGVPLIIPHRAIVRGEIANWFGDSFDEINITASFTLMYNAAIMVKNGIGSALGIRLESRYDSLCFIPLYPTLDFGALFVWKKNYLQSAAAVKFIEHCKKYL